MLGYWLNTGMQLYQIDIRWGKLDENNREISIRELLKRKAKRLKYLSLLTIEDFKEFIEKVDLLEM